MKSTIYYLLLILGMLVSTVHAETPYEQLTQMVEQLQQSPSNNALREKIIKLAPILKPSPALPDGAVTFEGRAQFAFRNAKSEDDYLAAAREYEKAIAAAPWVLGYYSDLCTIYEKADKFEDAKRNCGFYLIGLTDPAQMIDVKRRIAGLEFGIEKINSPQAHEATLLEKIEGEKFVYAGNRAPSPHPSYDEIFEIRNKVLYRSIQIYSLGSGRNRMISFYDHEQPGLYSVESAAYRDGAFTTTDSKWGTTCVYRIGLDGKVLIRRCSNYQSNDHDDDIPRQ